MNRPKTRLSYIIARSLTLLFIATLLILGLIVKVVFDRTMIESEKQKAELLLQAVEKPVQMLFYLRLHDQIQEKFTSLVTLPDVAEVSVNDRDGRELYRYVQPNPSTVHEGVVVVKRITEPMGDELLGTVRMRYSDHLYDQTRKTMHVILLGLGVAIGIIFVIAIVWIRKLLSPLSGIAQKMILHTPGELTQLSDSRSVEITQIVQAFNEMQRTTQGYLERIKSMNESLELEVNEKTLELEEQFYTDRLTGLPNRYRLQERLHNKDLSALAIVNVDDFQEVNDFFGIAIGDELLTQIGNWLSSLSTPCYRLGGDEFALTFTGSLTQSELEHRLQVLQKLLDEKIFEAEGESVNIRMTIGAAFGHEKILTRADIALHYAKQHKKPIAFYDQVAGIEEQYRSNLAMASTVRKALFEGRVICHFQPIAGLESGEVEKYETLVRMIDEDGEMIPPLDFLPIAKKTKLYPQITRTVVAQACHRFKDRDEEFSVNLSDSDMRDPHTVSEIIETITRTRTASRIVFEILESEGIENYEEVTRFIARVKALGAKIAIDDFGTGYSNFENILKLGVDYIKIDGSLIRGIGENTRHRIIVETIVDFAGKIGARTIAEFVGDKEAYLAIKELGIDYAQGYFIGKPAPLEERENGVTI